MLDSKNGVLGLVIGDAMGVPIEFCTREDLIKNPVTKMMEYGSHDVPKGSWSDDSSMVLATIDAIIEDKSIDCNTIANNFLQWIKTSKYTSCNRAFDVGRTCLRAISRFESHENVAQNCGGKSEMDNGNGSLMRMLPLIYYCVSKNMTEDEIYETTKKVSSITHGHDISIMSCFIYVMYGIYLLKYNSLQYAYEEIKRINYNKYFSSKVVEKFYRILECDIKLFILEDIKSTGYVVDTLEATLWVLLNSNSYNQAIIGAINLGDDTDTMGACVGGLAGIYYGLEMINEEWKNNLLKYDYIVDMCNKYNVVINSLLECKIEIVKDSIVEMDVEAIVNSASNSLLSGGGICGAIFKRAGINLDKECKKIKWCNTGEAVITNGYNLKAKKIIHAVPPKWYDYRFSHNKEEILRSCYYSIFKIAIENNIKTIAIPCLGAGVYQCPIEIGRDLAFKEAVKFKDYFEKIYFVCFTDVEYKIYKEKCEYLSKDVIVKFKL